MLSQPLEPGCTDFYRVSPVSLMGVCQGGKVALVLNVARGKGLSYRTRDDPTEPAAAHGYPTA